MPEAVSLRVAVVVDVALEDGELLRVAVDVCAPERRAVGVRLVREVRDELLEAVGERERRLEADVVLVRLALTLPFELAETELVRVLVRLEDVVRVELPVAELERDLAGLAEEVPEVVEVDVPLEDLETVAVEDTLLLMEELAEPVRV